VLLSGHELIGIIGLGAASRIYAGRDVATGEIRAIKHVVCHTPRHHRFVEQLVNEYKIGRQIRHPVVRQILSMQVRRTWRFTVREAVLVMELVDGISLDREPPKDLLTTVRCFMRVAEALHAINTMGYVHCDVKPNNILLNDAGQVKLIDLGQACPVGSVKPRIQGTPDFIAPEQVKRQPVDFRTDVYNFGASLYTLLCGKTAPTLFTLRRDPNSFLVDQLIPQPHEINPQVPENLSHLVMECIRVVPARRPQNFVDVLRRMEIVCYTIERQSSGQTPA
jgi:serine/threonine-protein kinase